VPIASVLKVMFLVAYLDEPDVRDRALTQSDRDLLEPMIRSSANDPASRIADKVGPAKMNALAERAGMRDFDYIRPPWGATRTSARDQAAFMLEVDHFVPQRHRAYALDLLTRVHSSQRWGIGQVATPNWTQHFKGGWGSGTGAVDHQVVMLEHDDGTRVALAVMTTTSPDHAYGKQTLEGVFSRLLSDLPPE
jgi:D-alanyl-D-alanine carboxypeptidase